MGPKEPSITWGPGSPNRTGTSGSHGDAQSPRLAHGQQYQSYSPGAAAMRPLVTGTVETSF